MSLALYLVCEVLIVKTRNGRIFHPDTNQVNGLLRRLLYPSITCHQVPVYRPSHLYIPFSCATLQHMQAFHHWFKLVTCHSTLILMMYTRFLSTSLFGFDCLGCFCTKVYRLHTLLAPPLYNSHRRLPPTSSSPTHGPPQSRNDHFIPRQLSPRKAISP